MGSLSSTPSVPQQRTVYVTQPTATVATTTEETSVDTDSLESEVRKKSLLNRERGRLGTIVNGFQGLLAETNSSKRKTLLGE